MTRVPFATREGMDAAGQAIWDEIDTSRGGVARKHLRAAHEAAAIEH